MFGLIVRQKADGSVINLAYDGDGIRVGKTFFDPTGTLVRSTSYLVDTNNLTGYAQVLEEKIVETAATTLRVYSYGSDLISSAQISSSTSVPDIRFYLHDAGGSVRELADDTGAITDRYTYDSFGVLIAKSGTSPNCYLYRSEQWDTDLGLYYNRARYLNTDSGRFWNADEYEGGNLDPSSLHRYGYGSGDPVFYHDPSGNFSLFEVAVTTTVVSTLNSLIYPKVNSAIAGAVGAIAGDKEGNNRYSLSSLGVYDESEQLLDALGLSPEDFSANLLAAAFTKLGTDATVSVSVAGTFAVASGVGRGIQAFRALKKVGSPAAETATAQAGDHIVLGLANQGLEQTAAQVGGRTLLNDSQWMSTLQGAIANPSTKITVSLDGLSGNSVYSQVMSAAQRGVTPMPGGYTNWELGQLYQAGRLPSVNFVQGGKLVANPFGP
jgi:RHS repeat-associated protein